ncbi:MAG: PQQ-like beta-propeller repeat protein [Candidatus Hydrogenedentes bacterium]|nr:PQQ-like beta-propeller repeat protein [Candidatus Hydrogenedentota bacterium]
MCSRLHDMRRPGRAWLPPACAIACLLLAGGLRAAGEEENDMTIEVRHPDREAYDQIDPAITPLARGHAVPSRPAAMGNAYYRHHGNTLQNGRVDVGLPVGEWELAWSAELHPGYAPRAVLASEDRLLVEGEVWELFDTEGARVADGKNGAGSITMDPDGASFYHISESGSVIERDLAQGAERARILPFLGQAFARPLIARLENRLLLVGNERQLDPQGRKRARRSLIEWIERREPERRTGSGLLLTAANAGTLILPSPGLLAASDGETVVAAGDGRLYISNGPGALEGVYSGDFEAVALSLGGNGWVYLAIRQDEVLRLWCITMSGQIAAEYTLPETARRVIAPPLVGHDGRIYLAAPGRLIALTSEGAPLWECPVSGLLIGAACANGGRIAIVTESAAGIVSPDGRLDVIGEAGRDPFCTGPAITPEGEIAVATRRALRIHRPAP